MISLIFSYNLAVFPIYIQYIMSFLKLNFIIDVKFKIKQKETRGKISPGNSRCITLPTIHTTSYIIIFFIDINFYISNFYAIVTYCS